jgi:hypothetical protein
MARDMIGIAYALPIANLLAESCYYGKDGAFSALCLWAVNKMTCQKPVHVSI